MCQENVLYIVFSWKFLEQKHKIYLYVYNTALIRVMGCFAIPVHINAVLFPRYWSLLTANTHFIRSLYAYLKRDLTMRIKWYHNAPIIRIYLTSRL